MTHIFYLCQSYLLGKSISRNWNPKHIHFGKLSKVCISFLESMCQVGSQLLRLSISVHPIVKEGYIFVGMAHSCHYFQRILYRIDCCFDIGSYSIEFLQDRMVDLMSIFVHSKCNQSRNLHHHHLHVSIFHL